jgi:hypothetical protein
VSGVSSVDMRRLLTLALAVGLAALVAVAAVDALRGSSESQVADSDPAPTRTEPPPPTADWVEDGPAIAARLARLGVRGTLYLSADGCLSGGVAPLRAVRLPDLALTEGPEIGSCAFSVSSDGRHAAGRDAVWSPVAPSSLPRRARR